MKHQANISAWARRYRGALMRRLAPESNTRLRTAQRLGEQAGTLGLEALDVARIHERALAALTAPGGPVRSAPGTNERARQFFQEVMVPIEQTHPGARKADAQAEELTQSLRESTREATATNRRLKLGVAQRLKAEAALKQSKLHRAELLAEAERLQRHLRKMTHRVLSSQEAERRQSGRCLQDEIAQALLAIHIRLLALNNAARAKTANLKKEIAETQRMVKHSKETIHRLAQTLDEDHEA